MNGPDAVGRETRRTWLVLALILALAAALRVLSFRGYTSHDASAYAQLAHMMVSGGFKPGMMWFFPVFSVRVGLFAPVALAFRLGGVNELMLTLYPFLLSMLSVLLAYFGARAVFGIRAGLIAACLMALLPIDARFASQLLPDMPAALYMNAGVLLVYAGSRQETVPRKLASGALAGLALFASWLCKETVLYLLPFIGAYLLWLVIKDRRNVTLLVAVAAAAGLLVVLEGWMYHHYAGDYFLRYHALQSNFESARRALSVVTIASVASYLLHRALVVLQVTILNVEDFGLMLAAALVACAYALFRQRRRFLLPALWFGWLLLLFSYGSASLSAYVPLHAQMTRFQYPMLLPAILLISGLASSMLAQSNPGDSTKSYRPRLFSGVLLFTYLVLVFAVTVAFSIRTGMGRRCRVQRAMARVLKPADPLYTDGLTAAALRFFWKYPVADSTHDFQGMATARIPSGAYVLLDRNELDLICNVDRYVPPKFLDSIPATWHELGRKDNATLYRVPPIPLSDSAWRPLELPQKQRVSNED